MDIPLVIAGMQEVEEFAKAMLRNELVFDPVKVEQGMVEVARQMVEETHVSLSPAGVRLNPVVQRYAWPSELDLMARMAGLRRKGRWGGWNREPFHAGSSAHVSVYGR